MSIERSATERRAFERIAIVNRGEAAMRLIHAVEELKRGGERLTTIALCTEEERRAMFVREADEFVVIHSEKGIAYLDYDELERALKASRADAAWVGWGFVAEHPEFADLCDRLGVTFIGPSGDVMRRLGDKIGAKTIAEEVGAPVAAWSRGPVSSAAEAERHAAEIGFPLLIKATAGGGGRGIRFVDRMEELAEAFERASSEAEKSFGDATVFMERRLTDARHIEVQVAADDAGNVWTVGVRDCSVQRRNQKVLEESHSPILTPDQHREVAQAAEDLVRAVDYRNLGTVEFLYQPQERTFAFLEVNTRLQVEHPVTELTTGVDLVKLQLRLAAGGLLDGPAPEPFGHAIEARLNAEDPQQGFAPAPGLIEQLDFAQGPGVRIDTGVAAGEVIPPDYDAMVAKVIAWGRDRDEARVRLMRALDQTSVIVRGGTTNRAFLTDLLGRPEFIDGSADTAWLDRLTAAGDHLPDRHRELALVVAAVDAWADELALERAGFYAWAARGRPQTDARPGRSIECRFAGERYEVAVSPTSPNRFLVEADGASIEIGLERLGRSQSRLTIGDQSYQVLSVVDGVDHLVEVEGVAHRVSRDSGGLVRAPAPALVVSIPVVEGQEVAKGEVVAVLESMKMETTVLAPVAGRVREIEVVPNTQIDAGAPILRLEPDQEDAPDATGDVRLDLAVLGQEAAPGRRDTHRCLALLESMRWQLLGFDTGTDLDDVLGEYVAVRSECDLSDPSLISAELAVLDAFADLSALSRNRHDGGTEEERHSAESYFHRYLRSLDPDAEGLPSSFRTKLSTALAHLGVGDLERTPALEQAAHQVFRAQQLAAQHQAVVMAVLAQPPIPAQSLPTSLADDVRTTLDKLIAATQVRHPSVGDQARSLRFRTFDEPLIEQSRHQVMTAMRGHLAAIADGDGDSERSEHIGALARCPYPLISLLADHVPGTPLGFLTPLLEVLTARNYRIRVIDEITHHPDEACPLLVARYHKPGDTTELHTVAALTDAAKLSDAVRAVGERASAINAGGRIVADIYVSLEPDMQGEELLARTSAEALRSADLPEALDRVAFAGAGGSGAVMVSTFRRTEGGWGEDLPVRGIHPMIAVRLGLGRLREHFDIEPLPTPAGTHLFRAVARDNPRDERLFAAAEVRDLGIQLDGDGRLTGLPGLEHIYTACIDGLRRAQAGRPDDRRLFWNRILLYVWEPVDFSPTDAGVVVDLLEPLGRGLGLEEVSIHARLGQGDGTYQDAYVRIAPQAGLNAELRITPVPTESVRPVNDYERKVVMSRQRGAVYPYELVSAIAGPDGTFTEHDLEAGTGPERLVPVDREPGGNSAGIVAGVASTPTSRHPEGMRRVVLIGDPSKSLGSLAEPECRLVIGALNLAEAEQLPVEWFSLSSGARISMESGTENMDWIAAALRRIVGFTQGGGEINVVVTGINVGAQPYWNAEATMLQHTKGILVMTPESAMVLTGKQALDISGGVSAEDNFGIGGYERIMGPNGQAQYFAPDLGAACDVLFAHYEHAYRAPGERFPRRAATTDPIERDVRDHPHLVEGSDFTTVGDIFSDATNPGRKKPFDIRTLMRAVADADHEPLERWAAMHNAETAAVFDAMLGGLPVSLVGVESRPLARHGALPADGPDQWTAGTLFPQSSKKVARAINAASGNRPIVFLANLSGFDGSPESLRNLQLEYGAEIGRAIVNFDGPIVFCVVSRYHGGAFVVFSSALNDNMQVLAVEGTYASVLGGAPAAAVVFAGEVDSRVRADPALATLEKAVAAATGEEAARLRAELAALTERVRSEKLGEVADEFDAVHSIERARDMGSVHEIIAPAELRPRLIEAVERGMARA